MKRQKVVPNYYTPEWVEAVAQWAKRQPLPTTFLTNGNSDSAVQYANALVACTYSPCKTTIGVMIKDCGNSKFKHQIVLVEQRDKGKVDLSNPSSIDMIVKNAALNYRPVSVVPLQNVAAHYVKLVDSPRYPGF